VKQVSQIVQIGKRRAIYIPKNIAEKLGLKEGDKVVLDVINNKIVLTPIKTGAEQEFWGEVDIEEVEKTGEEITKRALGD